MKKNSTEVTDLFVGLDVHKDSIQVTVAEAGALGEVRPYGRIGGDLAALEKVVRKLDRPGRRLRFVYEAGPCGYVIYRHLTRQGFDCTVIAPSLTPRRAGDRVKTDRRDATLLARLHRAGELTAVYVPQEEDEAMRDLSRAREDAKQAEIKARQQLAAFLLRHDLRYSGTKRWGGEHRRWLAELKLEHPAQYVTLQEYLNAIDEATRRVERLTEQIRALLPEWRLAPVVAALQAMRGVSLLVAVALVTELGDLTRFTKARQVMAFLGLVPDEHSSGPNRRLGGITKAGNSHARRALVEAAWAYHFPARVTKIIRDRQRGLQPAVVATAWQAQLRLCARYRRLVLRGKPKPVVITAVARELAAFAWSIARQVSLPAGAAQG
jgi:transposase